MNKDFISPEYFAVSTDATIENVIVRLTAKVAANGCTMRETNMLGVAMMTGRCRGLRISMKPCGLNWGQVFDTNARVYNAQNA